MKTQLDDNKYIAQYDTNDVYSTLLLLGNQLESAWHDSQFVNLNFEPSDIQNVVLVGMGGSGLPGHVVLSLSPLLLKTPFEIVANYRLPQYTSEKSLVILVSYSGNTEEVLSCGLDAKQRNCKIVAVATGGKLSDLAIKEHWPLIVPDEKLNPAHCPRFGIGLTLGAVIGLLARLNTQSSTHFDIKEVVRVVERTLGSVKKEIATDDNQAKSLAVKNKGQAIIIFSANHLTGVGKITANIIDETSKTFSVSFAIPDLNHHLMEGLTFPVALKDHARFILLDSSLYPEVIQKRFKITKEILIKLGFKLTVIKPESTDTVCQVFESLAFLTMISYYLCIVNKQDPGSIPWVDYFKKQLS